MSTMTPARSTSYAAICGAFTILLNWILGEAGVAIPSYAAQALTLFLTTAVTHFVEDY